MQSYTSVLLCVLRVVGDTDVCIATPENWSMDTFHLFLLFLCLGFLEFSKSLPNKEILGKVLLYSFPVQMHDKAQSLSSSFILFHLKSSFLIHTYHSSRLKKYQLFGLFFFFNLLVIHQNYQGTFLCLCNKMWTDKIND